MQQVHAPVADPDWPVAGQDLSYPIHRIFCVGRNYRAHAIEMGMDPDRDPPFYFMKFPGAYAPSGSTLPYPPGTEDYHFEAELVVALTGGGRNIPEADARAHVYGYAAGLDMTRRDLQLDARAKGRPWDSGKNFDASAPLAPLCRAEDVGHLSEGRISLTVNGEVRQDADLKQLIWSVDEIIAHLSQYHALRAGDIIMTGTPAGVGAVDVGDKLRVEIAGLEPLDVTIVAPESA